MTAGLLHALAVLSRRVVLGHLTWHHRDVLWMAPAAHLLVFLTVAAALAPISLLLSEERARRLAAGTFGFLSATSLLLPYDQLARWAVLIMAVGVGVQAARIAGSTTPRRRRRLGTMAAAMGVLALAITATQLGWRGWRERSTNLAAASPDRAAANVLLIILDTVRSENLSLYGYPRPTTPALLRRAGESTVFDQAVATTSWTLPSHATMLTGQLGSASRAGWLRPARLGGANLPRAFRSLGYATGGFVANLLYTSYESGLTDDFTHVEDYRLSAYQVLLHCPLVQTGLPRALLRSHSASDVVEAIRRFELRIGRYPADLYKPAPAVTDGFLAWQRTLGGRPFFAMLNYFDAHGPYRAPDAIMARFKGDGGALDRYDAAIAFLDGEVDRLLDELDRRGVLDQTLVVITSDHGDLFGEHDLKGHANALYYPLLRVPLVLRYPGVVPGGTRVTSSVSLVDLARTILDLSGHSSQPGPGVSLATQWSNPPAAPSPILAELARGRNVDSTQRNATTWLQSAIADGYQAIRNGEGQRELFDLTKDPEQQANLATLPEHAKRLERLLRLLDGVTPPLP